MEKFKLFTKELKQKIHHELNGHDKEKILEFMDEWKYESSEQLDIHNMQQYVYNPPVWYFYHCVRRCLREGIEKRNDGFCYSFLIYENFYKLIYKKDIYNTSILLSSCIKKYCGEDFHYCFNDHIANSYSLPLYSYPDINNKYCTMYVVFLNKKYYNNFKNMKYIN